MRRAFLVVLGLLPATALAETSADEAALFDRLNVREQILDSQKAAAEGSARERSLFAYRLCRRQELGFAPSPETRLDYARAFGMALVALRRSVDEAQTLRHELDRVRTERSAIEAAFVARATGEAEADRSEPMDKATRFVRPARGVIVAVPGSRRDGSSRIELRHDGVEMLARLNEPVRSIAAGTVRKVEALPQGGFAVVTLHAGGLTSIVTGLRDVAVAPAVRVSAGQTLGLAGRNLDGAAVVSVEIWRDRRAQNAARLLHLHLEPAS